MSGVKHRPRVVQVNLNNIKRAKRPIMTVGTVVNNLSTSFQEKTRKTVTDVLKGTGSLNTTAAILASSKINAKMKAQHENALATARIKGVDQFKTQKIAALASLSNYAVTDVEKIQSSITEILSAKNNVILNKVLKRVSTIAAQQHKSVFVSNLSTVCSEVTSKIGFSKVRSEIMSDGRVRIIGKDNNNNQLITEVEFDAKKGPESINMTTEVFGLNERDSSIVQESFSSELKKQGVIYEGKYHCGKRGTLKEAEVEKTTPKIIKPKPLFDTSQSISKVTKATFEKIKNLKF